jgi:hypothetical protein
MTPLIPVAAAGIGVGWAWWRARQRGLDRWLIPYAKDARRRRPPAPGEPVHLLLCLADHFEPNAGGADPAAAARRVRRWVEDYPCVLARFRDSDGRPPRHTFFYPQEEYEPGHLDSLAGLCEQGYGEVEVHLHHDADTPEGLRAKLLEFKATLAHRHGLLGRDRSAGQIAYGFIHGNWALNNSRPDGRWCGVDDEIRVLRETGCYADFTLPSAPSPTQTPTVNRLYYARSSPHRPRGHDYGLTVGSGPAPPDALLLVQGPLLFDWRRRKWGLLPRVENGCLQANQPPSAARLDLWLRARVQVPARPDWFFVKLHTHGASDPNRRVLLGDAAVRFHEELARRAAADPRFRYHYVTAREMYNLVRAAEAGWQGPVADVLDFAVVRNASARETLVGAALRPGRQLNPPQFSGRNGS